MLGDLIEFKALRPCFTGKLLFGLVCAWFKVVVSVANMVGVRQIGLNI